MQRLKKVSSLRAALLSVVATSVAGSAMAHEVQNSEIRAIFGAAKQKIRIEVWQTLPLEIAQGLVPGSSENSQGTGDIADSDVLDFIGQHSRVEAPTGPCALAKQAHRRVHHGRQLQMRFLFICSDNASPAQMTLAWMLNTPRNHFAVLEQNGRHGSPFKVIERTNPVIQFDRP